MELLGTQRKGKADGEREHRDREGDGGHLPTAQGRRLRRFAFSPEPAQERVAEREDEQSLEEPGRARRQVPDLLADEGPERDVPVPVPAVVDVLEEGTDQKGVRQQGDPEPDQSVTSEPTGPLSVQRWAAEAAGDEEEEPQSEQPAGAEHHRHCGDHGA